jgi:hypothetical protein
MAVDRAWTIADPAVGSTFAAQAAARSLTDAVSAPYTRTSAKQETDTPATETLLVAKQLLVAIPR